MRTIALISMFVVSPGCKADDPAVVRACDNQLRLFGVAESDERYAQKHRECRETAESTRAKLSAETFAKTLECVGSAASREALIGCSAAGGAVPDPG